MRRAEQIYRNTVRLEELIRDEMNLAHGDKADQAFSYDEIFQSYRDTLRWILNVEPEEVEAWCEAELRALDEKNPTHGNRDLT